MPNILRTMHNWPGYTTNTATAPTTLQSRMLAKRELDSAGLCTVIVIIIVAVVLLLLMIRCIRAAHARQYERSGGKARWSVHYPPQQQYGSHHVTRTNRGTDLESGYEMGQVGQHDMPQYPPPSYHSQLQLSQGNGSRGVQSRGSRTQGTRTQGTRTEGTRTKGSGTQGSRSQGSRSHGTRSKRTRPSQTLQQYLQSKAGSGSARCGAPSAQEYFSGGSPSRV